MTSVLLDQYYQPHGAWLTRTSIPSSREIDFLHSKIIAWTGFVNPSRWKWMRICYKITPKSANYCQVYCPNAQYMRIINTTWCYTCSVYHDEYYRKEGFFGLGQFGELTLHRPPMGGPPGPAWLFVRSFGCSATLPAVVPWSCQALHSVQGDVLKNWAYSQLRR